MFHCAGNQAGSPMPPRPPSTHEGRIQSPMATQGKVISMSIATSSGSTDVHDTKPYNSIFIRRQ